jgi:hypothetical protein
MEVGDGLHFGQEVVFGAHFVADFLVLDHGVEPFEEALVGFGEQCFVDAHDVRVFRLVKRVEDAQQRFQFVARRMECAGVD